MQKDLKTVYKYFFICIKQIHFIYPTWCAYHKFRYRFMNVADYRVLTQSLLGM